MRNLFREEISLGDGPSRYAASAGDLIAAQDKSEVTDRAQKAVTNMLSLTTELFDQSFIKAIEAAAATMMECPTIHLIAFRNNHAPAFFFYYVVRLLRKGVVLVDSSHGMLIDALGAIEPGDCALVITYEPYAKDAVNAANLAREAGAKIIAITDSPVSPVAPAATHVLVTPRLDVSFYQSSIPTIAVLEALIYFIVARSGSDAVERVSREFGRLALQGAYWDEHRKTS
ncbi:hypothetical protein ABB55_14445 [Prosthecomicrobium hirschii]|uniref:SIS domain-containing protein n=1 Tax=Prosthecodimorpha hirschii TaxID=665126 RepID=A0A0P6W7C0_9HYPH|nr:hypothetical protein ABB55_14445 [Prosthecomicrobium hirschii]